MTGSKKIDLQKNVFVLFLRENRENVDRLKQHQYCHLHKKRILPIKRGMSFFLHGHEGRVLKN